MEAAEGRGRFIASLPHGSPDLFGGTAGRLRFHLLLWDETGAREQLQYAVEAGERLVDQAVERESGALCWRIPEGYGGLSGKSYLGYAHGAAGIADSLLDLYDATGETRWLESARGAGRWLSRLATPALDDGSGLSWPSCEGEDPAAPYWCHGAAGIGSFWLHAARVGLLPEASDFAIRAAMTTARGSRWTGPPLCHGLAGSIELLLDAYQQSGDERHLAEGRSLGDLLEASAIELEGGLLGWCSESAEVVSPDYNVGYAGVACALLRLAQPATRPRALGRRGFRFGGSEPDPVPSLPASSKEAVV